MTNKIICVLIVVTCLVSGCKKYLDAKPNYTLTVPDNLPAIQALLDNGSVMNATSPSMGEASADDYYLTQDVFNSLIPIVQQAYIWNMADRSDYTFSNVPEWANLYLIVYNANLSLDQLSAIPRTSQNSSQWDNIKGSALFFRGSTFLKLLWLFSKAYDKSTATSDLGIALRLTSDYNVPSERANVEKSYEQTLSDLKQSIDYLPLSVSNPLRPSKLAAYGYIARTYLSMREYDSAYIYADKCLRQDSVLIDYNNQVQVNLENSYPFQDFNKEIVHEDYDNSFVIYSIIGSYASMDTTLYQSYEPNDLRKQAYFTQGSNASIQFRGSYKGDVPLFTGIAVDEMYLIRAECEARANSIDPAMADLNTLLSKRWRSGTFTPYTAASQKEATDIILKERRKELVFRDLRWSDIKRLNKEDANIGVKRMINGTTYILSPNDNRFALPLPTDIINLTKMKQNPQ